MRYLKTYEFFRMNNIGDTISKKELYKYVDHLYNYQLYDEKIINFVMSSDKFILSRIFIGNINYTTIPNKEHFNYRVRYEKSKYYPPILYDTSNRNLILGNNVVNMLKFLDEKFVNAWVKLY